MFLSYCVHFDIQHVQNLQLPPTLGTLSCSLTLALAQASLCLFCAIPVFFFLVQSSAVLCCGVTTFHAVCFLLSFRWCASKERFPAGFPNRMSTVGLPWVCFVLRVYLFSLVRFQDSNLISKQLSGVFSHLKRRRSVSEKDEMRKTRQDRRKGQHRRAWIHWEAPIFQRMLPKFNADNLKNVANSSTKS